MAYVFDTNQAVPATSGATFPFRLKELLKTQGWSVTSSSDGTTYNAAGDQITHSGAGADGMDNNLAWFNIQEPGANGRAFTWQRGGNGALWRVKYSGGPATGFVGGTPTATRTPSATDEVLCAGGGTDASPTFAQIFPDPGVNVRGNICAGGAVEGYSWYVEVHTANTATAISTFLCLDVLAPGTSQGADVDPAVLHFSAFNAGILNGQLNGTTFPGSGGGWIKKGLAGAGFVSIPVQMISQIPNGGGQNPYTLKDDLYPVLYMRHASLGAPFGWKGVSSVLKFQSVARANFDTYNRVASKDRIVFTGSTAWCNVPWDGSDLLI